MISTISSKGQVTIPKQVRKRLHLEPGDKVEFLVDTEGSATILPVTQDITRLKGMVQAKRPVSIEEMNQAIEQEGGRQ